MLWVVDADNPVILWGVHCGNGSAYMAKDRGLPPGREALCSTPTSTIGAAPLHLHTMTVLVTGTAISGGGGAVWQRCHRDNGVASA
jgi:hypothetical protein